MTNVELSQLTAQLESELIRQHGPMLTGTALCKALGYRSTDAFRQALARGTVPVPVFPIENRRGKFALTKEVAAWVGRCRAAALPSHQSIGDS